MQEHLTPMDAQAWAELHTLRLAVQGPDGFATWQDAAVAERVRRVKAEQVLKDKDAEIAALRKDAERLDFIQKNRIGLLPQMFADWDAEGYDEEGDPTVIASGNTLRELIDAAMAQAVQPS